MHPNPVTLRTACAAMLLAFAAMPAAAAETQPQPQHKAEFRLTVLPAHYAIGKARFADIAGVDTWLRHREGRVVAIDRCSSASAPHALAAVARFYPVANARLELRTLPSGAGGCARETTGANEPFIGMLRASDYLVTDEFGRSAIP